MVQLDYTEQMGHGVLLIVFRYGREAFDITEHFISVTIPLNHKSNIENRFSETAPGMLDSSSSKILELMKK